MDIIPEYYPSYDFFISPIASQKSDALMKVVDDTNKALGSHTIFFAAQGIHQSWAMRSEYRSPRYTTD